MSIKTEHTSKSPSGLTPSHLQYQEDEIDLVDIWRLLVRQRKLISVIALIIFLGASIYVFALPSVYKAEAFLLPPLAKDIAGLNVLPRSMLLFTPDKDIAGLNVLPRSMLLFTPDKVFQQTVLNLKLNSLQRRFSEEHKDISGSFSVRASGKGDIPGGVFVSLVGGDPGKLARGVNAFVEFINAYTTRELVDLLAAKLAAEKTEIAGQIAALRNQARQERSDRITVLEEALAVAQKLAIVDMVINPTDSPLYLRGANALSSEIEVLKKRKDDDAFIVGLRGLRQKLAVLSQIRLPAAKVRLAKIDQPAILSHKPIKPKRGLIIALAAVLGIMAGVFVAFIVNFMETVRRQDIPSGD